MIKKLSILTALLVSAAFIFDAKHNTVHSNSTGAPAGYSGSPASGSKTCAAAGCHNSNTAANGAGYVTLLNGTTPVTSYVPGTTYNVAVAATSHFSNPSNVFGFELSVENASGSKGTLAAGTDFRTKLVGSNAYVTQTAGGTVGVSQANAWNFTWTAPAAGTGSVTFYTVINKTNGDGSQGGDSIYKATTVITESGAGGIGDLNNNIQVASFPNPTNGLVNVNYTLNSASMATLSVYNLNGSLVETREITGNAGNQNVIINAKNYANGLYFVKIKSANTEYNSKFVKN